MSGALISLEDAKDGLHVEGSNDDDRINLLIEAATIAILRFLKSDGEEYATGSPLVVVPDNVPADIKAATIMLVGIGLDLNPEEQSKIFAQNELPIQVSGMIGPRRLPTLA